GFIPHWSKRATRRWSVSSTSWTRRRACTRTCARSAPSSSSVVRCASRTAKRRTPTSCRRGKWAASVASGTVTGRTASRRSPGRARAPSPPGRGVASTGAEQMPPEAIQSSAALAVPVPLSRRAPHLVALGLALLGSWALYALVVRPWLPSGAPWVDVLTNVGARAVFWGVPCAVYLWRVQGARWWEPLGLGFPYG